MNTFLMVLVNIIVYGSLMLVNEYAGFLLAVIIGAISFSVWGISHIVEWIQPSKVTRNYYGFVLAAWVGPLLAVLGFIVLRGEIGWLN